MQLANIQKELRLDLLAKMKTISERYGWMRGSQSLTTMVTKTISNHVCERQARHLLENEALAIERQRFDSYYRQKSSFATAKILECLKTRMDSEGMSAGIVTEASSEFGRYDVVVVQGYPCRVYSKDMEIVRIEVKASLGLDLEQIDRYLWDSSPLILARVIPGHVAKLHPLQLQSYVLFSLRELNAKADRLLSSNVYTIPGPSCSSCLERNCPNNRNEGKKTASVVTMCDSEFETDVNSFFKNLGYVAEKTASMVVEELKGLTPSRNQVYTLPLQGKVG